MGGTQLEARCRKGNFNGSKNWRGWEMRDGRRRYGKCGKKRMLEENGRLKSEKIRELGRKYQQELSSIKGSSIKRDF